MTWKLSWAIVNKTDPEQAMLSCYSGVNASADKFVLSIVLTVTSLLAISF